jgi:hypothetical protein
MAFARKYEYFEVRDMLKRAEGVASPVTGQGGHARGLHAMSPGHLDKAAQLDRVTKRPGESNNQFKNRGGTGKTGAFKSLLQQGSAACEALNSAAGQAALAVFDDIAHAGKKLRISIQVAGIKEAGFLPGTLAPHSTTVKKGDAAVSTLATTGVMMIIDRGANSATMQIQTCYPLSDPTATSWDVVEMPAKTQVASG